MECNLVLLRVKENLAFDFFNWVTVKKDLIYRIILKIAQNTLQKWTPLPWC